MGWIFRINLYILRKLQLHRAIKIAAIDVNHCWVGRQRLSKIEVRAAMKRNVIEQIDHKIQNWLQLRGKIL